MRRPPRVFVSYSHDNPLHEDLVRRFCEFLRGDCGVDAVLDRVAAESPQEWTAWIMRSVREADFVLCVASADYRAAADADLPADVRRGSQWEARMLREEFYRDEAQARARILPVVLPGGRVEDIPVWLNPTSATHYRVASFTKEGAEALLRYLTGQPGSVERPLGDLGKHPVGLPNSISKPEWDIFIAHAGSDRAQ
jgi:hypothetical protein